MTEITNSKRTLHQATYGPIEVRDPPLVIRAWEKWTYFASLAAQIKDFGALREVLQQKLAATVDDSLKEQFNETLRDMNTLEALIPHVRTPDALSSVKAFRDISPQSLVILGEMHLEMEERHAANLLIAYREIVETYSAVDQKPSVPAERLSREGYELVAEALPGAGDLAIYRRIRSQSLGEAIHVPSATESRRKKEDPDETTPEGCRKLETREGNVVEIVALPRVEALSGAVSVARLTRSVQLSELANWALREKIRVPEAKELLDLSEGFETVGQPLAPKDIMTAKLDSTKQLIDGFRRRMGVEPIGLLHLERISYTPAGMERGELVHSVPLSPDEEVNITHREWSNTSEEFEKLVTDYIESYSEQGVVEKSELAESSSHQTQHSSGYNTGVTASGGYGPVNVTASFNYSVQDSASSSAEASRKRSQEITNKASSRVKREHKVSFRVASAAGTEDQTVQKIKNPDPQKAIRVDYYQLIRKWRVDLERYGLRLTYDITIPEPGSDILSRLLEIQELEENLSHEFKFDLAPDKITRDNYQTHAAKYQASVEDPPEEELSYIEHKEENYDTYDSAPAYEFKSLEFNIDPRYRATKIVLKSWLTSFENLEAGSLGWDVPSASGGWDIEVISGAPINASGKVPIIYEVNKVGGYLAWVQITAKLKDEVLKSWQLKAWNSLRDAAETNFEANRQRYRDRLQQLKEQLEDIDALTLRKIEREEVMKGVIRWLFGPTFRFVPKLPLQQDQHLGLDLYGSEEQLASDAIWRKMSAYGEVIKFLHSAIEWENMLYFLYPYFWTHPKEWNDRKYIRHPDAMHQQFLKAGSARVVLTIRPGFEDSFLSLMEVGDYCPDALIQFLQQKNLVHPYVSIATEMQNYAKTNYPGIPSANPAKHGGAWRQIQQFSAALEKFYGDCGRYPTTKEGLAVLVADPGNVPGWAGPYVSDIPHDPWGNNYIYTSPGDHGGFDIVSYGADGQPGGKDEDADVVSWAEGSLVGTWIEYTPTSALDIAIGEKMPMA